MQGHLHNRHAYCAAQDEQFQISNDIALDFFDWEDELDPARILAEAFSDEELDPLGPQNHVLVAASLLTAYHNYLLKHAHPKAQIFDLKAALLELIEYLKHTVTCTISHEKHCSLDKAASAFLQTALKYSLSHAYTLEQQKELCQGLEHFCDEAYPSVRVSQQIPCCKMHAYITLERSCTFLSEILALELPLEPIECMPAVLNSKCQFNKCRYFKRNTKRTS